MCCGSARTQRRCVNASFALVIPLLISVVLPISFLDNLDAAAFACYSAMSIGHNSTANGCSNTCPNYGSDNDCDDGGPGAEHSLCNWGTDCADCGARVAANGRRLAHSTLMSSPPSPSPPPPSFGGLYCSNMCHYASDGDCDDGGPGSEYSSCSVGTDCVDCGSRTEGPSRQSPPPPSPSPPPPVMSFQYPPGGASATPNLRAQSFSSQARNSIMGPYLAAEAAVVAPTVGLFILYRLGKGGGRPKWKLGYCLATLLAVLAALGLIVIGLVLLLVGLSLLSLGSSSSSVLAGLLRSLTTPLYMQLGERATDDLGCVVAITDALRAAAGPALMLGHLHLLAAIVAIGAVHAACAASRRLPPSRVGIITAAGRPANRHHVAASAVRADPFPMSPARVVVEAVELNAVPIAMGTAVGGPLPIGTVISAEAPTVVGATTLPMATRVSGADPGSHRDSHDAPPPVAYPCGSVVAPPSYSSAAPPPSYGATSEPGGSSDLSVQWTDFSAEFRESSRSSGGHGA